MHILIIEYNHKDAKQLAEQILQHIPAAESIEITDDLGRIPNWGIWAKGKKMIFIDLAIALQVELGNIEEIKNCKVIFTLSEYYFYLTRWIESASENYLVKPVRLKALKKVMETTETQHVHSFHSFEVKS